MNQIYPNMITDRHKTWYSIEPLMNQSRTSNWEPMLVVWFGWHPYLPNMSIAWRHQPFAHIQANRRKTMGNQSLFKLHKAWFPSSVEVMFAGWTNTLSLHTGKAWSFFAKMHDVRFAQHQLQLAPLQDWTGIRNDNWRRTIGGSCCILHCIRIKQDISCISI